MDWQDGIISFYLWICAEYKNGLWAYNQRFAPYYHLSITDEEIATIYMCGVMEGLKDKKRIYTHAKNYWSALFPKLPSYVAFIQRLNRLTDVFIALTERVHDMFDTELFSDKHNQLIDSMPIVLAKGGRRFTAKVAPEIADKNGYCATKKMYYYGVKLHVFGSSQNNTIPVPNIIGITPAGISDVKAYDMILPEVIEYDKFADKAYIGRPQTNTFTPIKKDKRQKHLGAAEQLYSSAISSIRQPIESLFNWIEEKVSIQVASKVRSYNGLIVHIFGKLAVAMKLMLARFSS